MHARFKSSRTPLFAALELRDGVKADYHGKGVKTAVENIKTIIG